MLPQRFYRKDDRRGEGIFDIQMDIKSLYYVSCVVLFTQIPHTNRLSCYIIWDGAPLILSN